MTCNKEKLLADSRARLNAAYIAAYPPETKPVWGEGSPDSRIVLIGEAPGAKETEQGKPFVGKAGENLTEFLNILGLSREELYITNTVKHRPYRVNPDTGRLSNRPPTKAELEFCSAHLREELQIISPALIVTLGNVPLQAIRGTREVIGALHGRLTECRFGRLYPLYHPASIIYNRALKDTYYSDLERLRHLLPEIFYSDNR